MKNPEKDKDEAEQKHVHIVPFSHLDLFWLGTREECLSRGNHLINKAMSLLEKHEDFRFLLETMNFVDNYLSCFPEEFQRIKSLIEKGQLEFAPLWSAIYLNLPSGETLARNLLYGRRFALKVFDCNHSTAHFGDLPGYTPQYPQIAKLGGIDAVLISRGGPAGYPLFRWEGLDGSKVITYSASRGYGIYSVKIDWHGEYEKMADGELAKILEEDLSMGVSPFLVHWGCDLFTPNEGLIRNIRRWSEEQKPFLQFSTLKEYFDEVRDRSDIPAMKGEIPSSWPNIESSWPDIWPEDMKCEAALNMAEFLSALCLMNGWTDYPSAMFDDAWKSLLDAMDHNQNSQGGDEADRDKLELKLKSRFMAEKITEKMAWRLASRVKAPHDKAFPVILFNSMSWPRSEVVRARGVIFGEVRTQDIPEFRKGIKLVDENGNTVPYVPMNIYKGLSFTLDIAFRAADVPAAGYKTYYLVPGENPYASSTTCSISIDADADKVTPRRNIGCNVYESRYYKVSVDAVTGDVSIYDVKNQRPLIEKLSIEGVEERRGDYIFNMAPSGRSFPAVLSKIETVDNNALWCRIRISGTVYEMPFVQVITLFNDSADIKIENEVDWKGPRWVRLEQLFSYPEKDADIRYGVPFGFVKYPETMPLIGRTKDAGDEVDPEIISHLRLCRDWVDIGSSANGISIGSDHRMWEFDNNTLRSYMVRGCGFCFGTRTLPDGSPENIARPPAGRYKFSYQIRPRSTAFEESNAIRCGLELNNPMRPTASAFNCGKGEFPASQSMLDFKTETSSIVMSALKKAEDGNAIVLRCFESTGKETLFNVPEIPGRKVFETDLLEELRTDISGNAVTFSPFEIKTFIYE